MGLVAAGIWGFLRLLFALIYAAGLLPAEWTGPASLPMDLPVYILGGENFHLRHNLYPQDLSSTTFHYPYSPPFAMLSMVLLWIPEQWIAFGGTLISILAYVFTFFLWGRLFQRYQLNHVSEKMALTLPVWLIFSAFWGDLSFLNIGILVALIATLLIEAVLEERLGWATLWLTCLFISKLMWAFPVVLPFLLGRHKFFLKLVVGSGLAYLGLVAISAMLAGPEYLWQQYAGYFNHLQRISTEFPWRVWSETPILGYNQSLKQILIFFLGDKPGVQTLATVLKIGLLTPLGIVAWKLIRANAPQNLQTNPALALELAFALYLGAFIWLDIVWEVLLGIVIFPYLLATTQPRWIKTWLWAIFLPYALVDMIQLISIGIGGDSVVIMKGGFIVTDPSIYIPIMMLIILSFYALIVKNLWNSVVTRGLT